MFDNRSTGAFAGRYCLALVLGVLASTSAVFAASTAGQATQTQLTKAQQEGKQLVFSRSKGNCLACHAVDGGDMPGTVGPRLVHVKKMIPKRSVLFRHIWDETQFNPQTPMPPFGRNLILSKDEINKIIDYLYTQ